MTAPAPAPTVADIDRDLTAWRDIYLTAIDADDLAGEVEARDEMDRLLDLRCHLPQQAARPPITAISAYLSAP